MSAAENLTGLALENGWKVVRYLSRHPDASGGNFSVNYVAEKDGRLGFVKAFDFSAAFQAKDVLRALQTFTTAYNYERDVLAHCKGKRLSNVVIAIDGGEVSVPGFGVVEGRVYYLVFEKADNDVRVQMSVDTACGVQWCMTALRDVSLALWQVHREMIAHQDMKPSNVLFYDGPSLKDDPSFKVADFGRASRRGLAAVHDDFKVAGDKRYAPPELLYGFCHGDFMPRRIGCDLYMLGNLAAFLFSGTNVTARLFAHLDPQHHPLEWGGTYAEVLPYLRNAFTNVLDELSPLVDKLVRDDVLRLVRELCDPDLSLRGHPKGIGRPNQYSLERYVSQLDLIEKRLRVRVRLAA